MKKILIISAYPNHEGFGAHLANTYSEESKEAGHQTELIVLSKLDFNPILLHGYKGDQKMEIDLLKVMKSISGADHLVFFFPIWWGGAPAILKGFFDRVFLPGFAFDYSGKYFPKKLLINKSARIIVTMDTPVFFDSIFLGSAGVNLIKKAILQFCGINPVRITKIGRLRFLTDRQKKVIILKIKEIARKAN